MYFLFIQILKEILWAKNGDPDETPHNVATGLGLRCWQMPHKKGTRLTCILIKNQIEPWWGHPNPIHQSKDEMFTSVLLLSLRHDPQPCN